MKRIKVSGLFLLAFLLLFIPACNKSNTVSRESEDFIKVLIHPDVKDLNTSVVLRLDPYEENSLKMGDTIHLEAINQSNRDIYFAANPNIQILRFDKSSQRWIKIKNSVNYYGEGYTTVPKGREGLQSALVTFHPMINSAKGEEIRVAITGFIVQNGNITDEPISAFIDLTLKP